VTEAQLARLDEALERIDAAGVERLPEWLSVGSSAALVAGQTARIASLAARHGMRTMLRPGLALYGLTPEFAPPFGHQEPGTLTEARARLKPVLTWKTRVTCVRRIPAGAVVGYSGTFVASEPMRLALLAAGYADGLDRLLATASACWWGRESAVGGARQHGPGGGGRDGHCRGQGGRRSGDSGHAGRRDHHRFRPRRGDRDDSLGGLYPHCRESEAGCGLRAGRISAVY